jgi:hypothetical protein
MRSNVTTAALAGLSLLAVTVSYLVKGAVPDVVSLIATTTVGGFLGVTIPHTPTTSK